MKARDWMFQYGVAILLALLLGVILGHIPLFTETPLGSTKLRAADVVQFLGYGGALLMLWLFGRQVAMHVPEGWKWLVPFRHLILPLTMLIVVTAAYGILQLIFGPFLQKTGKMIYNWIFVIGIASASIWLVVMWFLKSAPLVAALDMHRREKSQAGWGRVSQP